VATQRLGNEPHIEAAHTVSRGGVAGFFAKERFQIRARAHHRDPAASPWGEAPFDIAETPLFDGGDAAEAVVGETTRTAVVEAAAATSFGSALEAALYQQPAEAEAEDDTTRVDPAELSARVSREDQIRDAAMQVAAKRGGVTVATVDAPSEVIHLDPPPPPPPPPAAPPSADAAATDPTAPAWRVRGPGEPVAPGLGRVDWGKASLVRLGLPTTLIEAAAEVDVRDDLGWVSTMADVVAPLCRDLPMGPSVFVGAGVERIAATLGLGFVRPGDEVIPEGSFCTSVSDDQAEIGWLMQARGDRNLHLVIGNEPWMHLLVDDPSAVSFVVDRGVVDALYVAMTLGAPLGYGPVDGSRRLSRVDAVDTALTIRRLVGRR